MDVIRDAAHTVTFAARIARDRGEIGVETRAHQCTEGRGTVLGAEYDVDEEIGERLRHGERINRAFSPLSSVGQPDPGRCPGLG